MNNQEAFYHLPPQVMAVLAPLNVAAGIFNPDIARQVRSQLRGRILTQGQFLKLQVMYLPVSLIPPAVYFYECSSCVFYRQSSKTCELVEGNIEPFSWCGLWLPKDDDKPFSWLTKVWR